MDYKTAGKAQEGTISDVHLMPCPIRKPDTLPDVSEAEVLKDA